MTAPEVSTFDVVVIGSGPAGHAAALHAARAGRSVVVIERDRGVGGACVQRGTIPSKTLRETAVYFAGLRIRTRGAIDINIPPDVQLQSLMGRMEEVVHAHSGFMSAQLRSLGIEQWHGRARFVDPHTVEVQAVRGGSRIATGQFIVVATGSRPRTPPHVPVDHDHILDSDSLLGTMYLPKSLAILGGGVIASEYASIFASLGVEVVMIDRYAAPMGFLDPDLTDRFVAHFEAHDGCRFLGERGVVNVHWDGVDSVVTELDDGEVVRSEKMFCALGRVANLEDLRIEVAGLSPTDRGVLAVDEHCRTAVPHIYAAGDVIGPPSLASSSKEQGRRAMCHALKIPAPSPPETIPVGIYTIPEISCVGLTEQQARERHGEVVVGTASFGELARGVIGGNTSGFLKLVASAADGALLGAHVVGEGATELVHVGQMALLSHRCVDVFLENVFNFPTLAEAYQLAALDVARQRNAVGAGA